MMSINRTKRTVVMITECPYSGVLRSMLVSAKMFSATGYDIIFVVPKQSRDRYGENAADNLKLLRRFGKVICTPLRRRYRYIIMDAYMLKRILSKFDYATHVISYAGYAGKLCRLLYKFKYIMSLYHVPQCIDFARRGRLVGLVEFCFEKYLSKYVTKFIACGSSEAFILNTVFKVPPKNILLIHNSVDCSIDMDSSAATRNIKYLIVSRVAADKRIEPVLRAASVMGILSQFVVIGSGCELEGLKCRYAQATFLGRLPNDEIVKYLKRSSFLISNSMIEGLPFSVLEAMAYGVVPVLSAVEGHTDIIIDGCNGFLFSSTRDMYNVLCKINFLPQLDLEAMRVRATETVRLLNIESFNSFCNSFNYDK